MPSLNEIAARLKMAPFNLSNLAMVLEAGHPLTITGDADEPPPDLAPLVTLWWLVNGGPRVLFVGRTHNEVFARVVQVLRKHLAVADRSYVEEGDDYLLFVHGEQEVAAINAHDEEGFAGFGGQVLLVLLDPVLSALAVTTAEGLRPGGSQIVHLGGAGPECAAVPEGWCELRLDPVEGLAHGPFWSNLFASWKRRR
jgi:hypothetical protein